MWDLTTRRMCSLGTCTKMANTLYLALISNGVAHMNKQLWRLKVPLKIKIFMWYMRKEVVLTKDNLVRCNWSGSK
jgi:hypothetical protein